RSAVLDGDDAASGERLAVSDAIDVVEDRDGRVARPQEVGVQRVDRAVLGIDRAGGGDERLARDLASEDALAVLVGAHAPEDVDLAALQIEPRDRLVDLGLAHRTSLAPAGAPSR